MLASHPRSNPLLSCLVLLVPLTAHVSTAACRPLAQATTPTVTGCVAAELADLAAYRHVLHTPVESAPERDVRSQSTWLKPFSSGTLFLRPSAAT